MTDPNSPVLPKDFNANQPKTIRLYPLSNYTFGTKDGQPEEDPSVLARLKRLEEHYQEHGMRRTCEGILVCHEHNHPHILMLQIANAFFKLYAFLGTHIGSSDTLQTRRLPPRRGRRDRRLQGTAERAPCASRHAIHRRRRQRRVAGRRHACAMVATQLRDIHVSLHPCACHPAQGVQEALLHTATA
jgi:hypothetical protein